jgi:hypothetical protein
MDHLQTKEETSEEKPLFFSTWEKLYSAVILNLIVLNILFYLFTEFFK